MIKYVKYIFFIILICCSVKVKAVCDTNEFNRLKGKAKEVQISYDLVEDNSNIYFNLIAFNLDSEIKALIIKNYYLDDYKEFVFNDTKQAVLKDFNPGEIITITFKAYVLNDCSGDTVYTKVIKLPYYNSFYYSNECMDHPDFIYCKDKLLENDLSSNRIYDEYYEYIEKLNNQDINEKEIITKNIYNYELITIFLGCLLFIISLIFVIMTIIHQRKKNEL